MALQDRRVIDGHSLMDGLSGKGNDVLVGGTGDDDLQGGLARIRWMAGRGMTT